MFVCSPFQEVTDHVRCFSNWFTSPHVTHWFHTVWQWTLSPVDNVIIQSVFLSSAGSSTILSPQPSSLVVCCVSIGDADNMFVLMTFCLSISSYSTSRQNLCSFLFPEKKLYVWIETFNTMCIMSQFIVDYFSRQPLLLFWDFRSSSLSCNSRQ